jgi:hypothetical protein
VEQRTSQHEIGACGANLRAIMECADVLGRGVLAAHFEAMADRLHADRVTVQAVRDALLHLAAHLVVLHRGHVVSFLMVFLPRRFALQLLTLDQPWIEAPDAVNRQRKSALLRAAHSVPHQRRLTTGILRKTHHFAPEHDRRWSTYLPFSAGCFYAA